jgi:hypothetical protein
VQDADRNAPEKKTNRRDFGPLLFIVPVTTIVGAFGATALNFGVVGFAIGAAVGLVWSSLLGLVATQLSSKESWRLNLAQASILAAALVAGALFGGGLLYQLLMSAGINSPSTLPTLLQSAIGNPLNLFFITFNTLMEYVCIPAAIFFNWNIPRRRRLLLPTAVLFYAMRIWTYVYFAPLILHITATTHGPLSTSSVALFQQWVQLNWGRNAIDSITYVVLLGAAFLMTERSEKFHKLVDRT